jgi:hypothetical protein
MDGISVYATIKLYFSPQNPLLTAIPSKYIEFHYPIGWASHPAIE